MTCPAGEFPCDKPPSLCYPASERCNNQKRCPDGADEANCYECQPGNFHCGKRCIFEMWQCDGHEDCFDGSDEKDCLEATPREVIAAALIGSLACSLMLVIALGCALKLCSLRSGEYRWSTLPRRRLTVSAGVPASSASSSLCPAAPTRAR